MTNGDTDPTTLGNLYWYLHEGWQEGTSTWKGRELIGRGGWQEYKCAFATSDGVIYAIDWDGNLWWYRYNDWRGGGGEHWSGRSLVGEGGWATYQSVFATTNGILYAIDWNGNLYWYQHKGWQSGTQDWEGRKLVGEGGWLEYTNVFATSDGVLYGISPKGDLYWYKHTGWQSGSQDWEGRKLVGQDGWLEYTNVFATSDGVLYGISPKGDLYWYKHTGWQSGSQDWEGRKLVGQGGWRMYSNVLMTSDGVLFGVHNNVPSRIKHIVYLMLENRSLDNVLGWLYPDGQRPDRVIAPSCHSSPEYDGLREDTYYNLDSNGNKQWVTRGTDDLWVPWSDPYEDYAHINNQLFESESNPATHQRPTMGGFYKDFYTSIDNPAQIMQTYTPNQLPVLNGIARKWAVSDAYFSSVPTQTNCNRAFAAAGNSIAPDPDNASQLKAWVDNNMSGLTNRLIFNQRTMFNVLYDAGLENQADWMIFASEQWPYWVSSFSFTRDILQQLYDEKYDSHFDSIDVFFDWAEKGALPSVCFLEPRWGLEWHGFGWPGNDYHPPTYLGPGEEFVAKIVEALQKSPNWDETLLIINFDEHGGTYDHVPPPWNAAVPWGGDSATQTPDACELDFGFDRFGVRVPLILVSPYVDANTVFRAGENPYDHASVIATILTMMGIPRDTWKLGNRVEQAPTFENVLTRSAPRTDTFDRMPVLAAPTAVPAGLTQDPPPSDLQREIAMRILGRHLRQAGTLEAIPLETIASPLANAKTISELSKALAGAIPEKASD